MDNVNTPEYLEKIKIQVIENLKRTAFAPSVQMQDVPRDSLGMDDDDEAILDDMDEDDNPDTRHTKRRFDKYKEKTGELSESEDEDGAKQNGIMKSGGPKRRNIMDYQNPNAVSDIEPESGVPTPDRGRNDIEEVAASVNAEVSAEILEAKQSSSIVPAETGTS